LAVVGVGARVFVWGVWALTLGALLAFVAENSNNVPWSDDLVFLDGMLSPRLSLDWLLEPYNGHFVPIPRLMVYALGKLTNYDFRAGMYISILVLGAITAALIWTAQSIRGGARYTDAIFPLAILSFGHMENFLQNWGAVVYTLVVTLAGLVLIIVARCHGRPTLRQAVFCGVCAILLPLNGSLGAAFVAPVFLWLGAVALSWWRSGLPDGRRNGLVIGSLLLLALLTFPLTYYSLKQDPSLPARPSVPDIMLGVFQMFSLMFGSGVVTTANTWALEVGVLADILLVLGLACLAWQYLRQPGQRFRTAGLVIVLGGVGTIALATAIGRASNTLSVRYAIFMVLVPCTLYLAGVIHDRSAIGKLWQASCFVLFCLLLSDSTLEGLRWAKWVHEGLNTVENDVRKGVPAEILVRRHLVHWLTMVEIPAEEFDEDVARHVATLRQLRENRSGIFVDLKDMPQNYQEFPVPVEPARLTEMIYQDGIAYGRGENSSLTYTLGHLRKVYAIRLKGTVYHLNPTAEKFTVSWAKKKGEEPADGETVNIRGNVFWHDQPSKEEFAADIWVNDTIDSFRVQPDDKPSMIQISNIELLVPHGS
jgi:hypothetical protein